MGNPIKTNPNEINIWSYISKKPCGCLTMAIVDKPERKKEIARELARAIRLGEIVERVTTESVRNMGWKCREHGGCQEQEIVHSPEPSWHHLKNILGVRE